MMRFLSAGMMVALASLASMALAQQASPTLQAAQERGAVICGVNPGMHGFAQSNSLGQYSGLDVDLCRAVASAVFDDPEAVDYLPLDANERFEALSAGRLDVLSRNTTWTMQRNSDVGEFVGVNYYDGQGFMVGKRTGIRSALELDNRTVCVIRSTSTELNAVDYFNVMRMRFRPVYHDNETDLAQAYSDGECEAMTTDRSGLAAIRADFAEPEAHVVLPEFISKEPLGPMVRFGDPVWANIVRWSLNCMINAEEMGITQNNVDAPAMASSPAARRLLGIDGEFGAQLGLDNRWCRNIIRHVGNYGESYERHVGPDTALGLERTVNGLWTNGGLHYAPPIR